MDYWSSPAGITRRIKSLSQDFTYKIVNNAYKIVAPTNGASWMKWLDVGDDRVCPICQANRSKGCSGWFKVTWFTPAMPAHPGCRCQWEIVFDNSLVPVSCLER